MNYSDFYVYTHKRNDTDEIFYIGKGRLKRAYLKTGRSLAWKEIAEKVGYHVEFVKFQLTNKQACDLELKLVSQNKNLVNKIVERKTSSLDLNLLSEWVEYDSNSPSGLTWVKSKGKIKKNSICGVLRNGRYSFNLLNNRYICSRVVWLLNNGDIDTDHVVDHIDGNPLNNTLENLREVSYKENSRNTTKHRSDRETLGVVEYTTTDINGRKTLHCYGSYYDTDGIEHRKSFSFLKYGKIDAIKLAVKFREEGLKCYQC